MGTVQVLVFQASASAHLVPFQSRSASGVYLALVLAVLQGLHSIRTRLCNVNPWLMEKCQLSRTDD